MKVCLNMFAEENNAQLGWNCRPDFVFVIRAVVSCRLSAFHLNVKSYLMLCLKCSFKDIVRSLSIVTSMA